MDSLIRRGIDQTILSEFELADRAFQEVISRRPAHIVGYFYHAATFQSKMLDYETDLWEEDFQNAIDWAVQVGEKQLEASEEDAIVAFYLGSTYMYKALHQGKKGALVPAFLSARKGMGYLETAVAQDSTLYDREFSIKVDAFL